MHNLDFKATTYSNGKFESQTMCNENKTDGFRVYWYESGQMKSAAEYKHGKLDGLYTEWYEDGTKSAEINYVDGVKHGDTTRWHKNSQMKLMSQYKYGNLDGLHTTWHENRRVKSESEYRHYRLYGAYSAWHKNGNKSIEINYLDGHRHGVCTLWHKDGLKRSEVTYVNGKMDGLWVAWHSTGQIRRAVLFKGCRTASKATWYSDGNIKYNSELGDEYFNRRLCEFSNVSYGEWVDYYSSHPSGFEFPHNGSDLLSGGVRYPILTTHWYKNGQKAYESIQYGYDDSYINWHKNGQKSFEAGKKNSDPCISWNSQGIKEYEYIFDFDSIDDGMQTTWKFFNNTGRYAATIILNEKWNVSYEFDLFEWEFFDTRNNKLYEYKYSYSESASITTDELWDVWLNSECREFVEILKSIEKHKSVFCKF
jgi:antitoxin component YwqK of YwqJK toxin-antitoxin module